MLAALYLVSIVSANLLVTMWGPGISILAAFVFIGLDLTCRDRLHDKWGHNGLVFKMGLLILAGSIISGLINYQAQPIAIASFVAFALSAIADSLVYMAARQAPALVRVNLSNIAGAATDSCIFPTLAFGAFLPLIILGQFAAKVAGGFVWSLILGSRKKHEYIKNYH